MLTNEQRAWAEKHHKVIALLCEGTWRAVPITPTFEMLSAMADQSPDAEEGDAPDDDTEAEDDGNAVCADLMRWYAALAMVRQPEPDFWHDQNRIVLSRATP